MKLTTRPHLQYTLGLPLDDAGFDHSVLREFLRWSRRTAGGGRAKRAVGQAIPRRAC